VSRTTDTLITFFALYLTTLFSLDTWAAARGSPYRAPGANSFYRPASTPPAPGSYQAGMHGLWGVYDLSRVMWAQVSYGGSLCRRAGLLREEVGIFCCVWVFSTLWEYVRVLFQRLRTLRMTREGY
jgi:hypothetical protein